MWQIHCGLCSVPPVVWLTARMRHRNYENVIIDASIDNAIREVSQDGKSMQLIISSEHFRTRGNHPKNGLYLAFETSGGLETSFLLPR